MQNPPPRQFFCFPTALLVASLALSGCGQFGDLYLPEPAGQEATASPDDTETPDEAEPTAPED